MTSFIPSTSISLEKSHKIMHKFYIIVIIIFSNPYLTKAQICEGNLGINIFLEGDFGSGNENIPSIDPGIAPGYIYSTNPPPNDGFYCLTNDITVWNQNWGWANIGDNSNDPNGYMMVVNASFDTGLFYEQVVDGLCENTLFEFSADIRNLHFGANIIKPNVSFLIDDIVQFSTGDVPENNQWITSGFTFTTNPGQTSVKLSLRNNAPGGIGNDLAIDNITFRACGPEALILPTEIENICEDGSPATLNATINGDQYDTPAFQWQQSFDEGITWVDLIGENDMTFVHTDLSAGLYYYRYYLANDPSNVLNEKCRVVSNVKVVKVIAKFYNIIDSLCSGLSYNLGDIAYSSTGIYSDSLKNFLGCDSIITLDLTIVPDSGISFDYDVTDPTCFDGIDGNISIDNISNAIPPYDLFLNDFDQQNMTFFDGLSVGSYQINIVDKFQCSETVNITINGPEPFVIDLGDDQEVELGEIISLSATGNYIINNYSWLPSEDLPCSPNCDEQTWAPTNSTWVIVNGISENGCFGRDSVFITVRKSRKVYISNSFSPNDDQLNDLFGIQGVIPNIKEVKRFEIYDRWGNKVFAEESFQANDPSFYWDGRFNNRNVSNGVFAYFAEIEFLDGDIIIYKGNVTVNR